MDDFENFLSSAINITSGALAPGVGIFQALGAAAISAALSKSMGTTVVFSNQIVCSLPSSLTWQSKMYIGPGRREFTGLPAFTLYQDCYSWHTLNAKTRPAGEIGNLAPSLLEWKGINCPVSGSFANLAFDGSNSSNTGTLTKKQNFVPLPPGAQKNYNNAVGGLSYNSSVDTTNNVTNFPWWILVIIALLFL